MTDGVLGLIVARAGSKRLPGKNMRSFLGAPLLAHTIAAARAAARLDRIVISTEDPEIAGVAAAYGCEAPFMRPPALAEDCASSVDVAIHALDTLEAQGDRFSMLVLLQPTSPLRRPSDIDACVDRCVATGAPASVTVALLPKPVSHFGAVNLDGTLDRGAVARAFGARAMAVVTGACYAIRPSVLREARTFLPEGVTISEAPWFCWSDIDSLEDFMVTEKMALALSEADMGWRRLVGESGRE